MLVAVVALFVDSAWCTCVLMTAVLLLCCCIDSCCAASANNTLLLLLLPLLMLLIYFAAAVATVADAVDTLRLRFLVASLSLLSPLENNGV